MRRSIGALNLLLPVFFGAFWSVPCLAGKLDIAAGFFSLSAKTSRSQGNVSTVGSYLIQYRYQFGSKLEIGIGYSVLMSKGVGGDLGYGPEVGLSYYPLTRNSSLDMDSFGTRLNWSEIWKPFIGASFTQRQFQTVQSSYAGVGFTVGTERFLDSSVSALGLANYRILSGNSGATANELNVLLGISLMFHYLD